MPLLSSLSRRFQGLTTDATPDPPRVNVDYQNSDILKPPKVEKPKSDESGRSAESRGKSEIPTSSTSIPEFPRKTRTKCRARPSQSSVVNYNIVNSNGVKIGARTSYTWNVSCNPATAAEEAKKPEEPEVPPRVEEARNSREEITLDEILAVKNHIGGGWRDVAKRLGYSDGQLDQFHENYRSVGVDEVIYQLLLDWKRANTKEAQIGRLVDALWSCREFGAAQRLAKTYSARFF